MGEKRRSGNWDRGICDNGERWPSKSSRRWGQQNHARFNTWGEEGSSKPDSNGWGDSYPSVPSWVRTFCTFICRVPWRKICDARRMLATYKNVAEWDDSAGLEAFENAKARYWAKINRLPCNLPSPNPYMYLEKVNFDAFVDPALIADLESTINPDTDNNAVVDHSDTVAHEPAPKNGSGEADQSSVNWDKYVEKPTSRWDDEVVQCDPWGSERNQSIDVDGRDGLWKHRVSWKDQEDSWKHQEDSWKNIPNRRNGGWNHMNSIYQMSDHQMSRSWNNNNSLQKNRALPQRTWHRSEFLGSRNHQRTGCSDAPWQRQNAVS